MSQGPQDAILYQSADGEITLIDIPTSIALAQDCRDPLLSTPPLEHPLQSKENHRSRSKTTDDFTTHHAAYKTLIQQALLDISAHVLGSWCAPREVVPQLSTTGKTALEHIDLEKDLEFRLREWAAEGEKEEESSCNFQAMMASLGAPEAEPLAVTGNAPRWVTSCALSEEIADQGTSASQSLPGFYNAEHHSVDLVIARAAREKRREPTAYHFTVPPLSAFHLGDCDHPDSFRSSFRHLTDEHNLPRHFDLVLLDPPWPNRSAKRKGAYEQIGGMPYLKKMLLKMDIDNYLEHNALVCIWITNKPALRDLVLGPGGLFETWNVGLIEEWIWIKTTIQGQPMFDIDDAMRKPYEVLLLGRAGPNTWTRMAHSQNPRRRVIAAVPDLHSRKPNLKSLLELYVPDPARYSALEIFARSLVAGWMSWGNEVVKYNSHMYRAKHR